MKTILSSETMDIPDGVSIKVKAKVIEVEGPRGKLTRNFKHLNLDFHLIKDEETGKRKLRIEAWFGSRKTSAAIRTALSHVENLITGVTKGYRYKMRFVYAHFPINASITNGNKSIEIRNFLGEKKVRKVDMLEGVSIVRSEKVKDEIVLDGNDIELVSRSAALINQKCHVKNKDIRKFLDELFLNGSHFSAICLLAEYVTGNHDLDILKFNQLVLLVKKLLGLSSHASLHGHRTPEWNTKLSFRCEALAWSGICALNYPVINMISLPNGMTSNKSGITLAITSFMSIPKNIPCSSPKHRTIPSPKGRKWPR
ncbi:hypothetical protein PVK06_037201 [Gossypium arboreum]|uniref:Large ribosomal subunit protein uL6 alpha-beta domain-containing protein n=1 Tax=Gossypium arboreum TaxID=29729 RepID=A0ABR0MWM8_GOSAR|nr:hypothetical protein PVK06_037201 [Gossypium arboreum]